MKTKRVFWIILFLINFLATTSYCVLSYLKIIELSEINFTLLILYCITVNICFGETIIKEGYGNSVNNRNSSE